MTDRHGAWPDPLVTFAVPRLFETLRHAFLAIGPWNAIASGGKIAVRFLAQHTGLPALVVAAILVAVGYRLLKRSARFALEVTAVALVLVAATELGWIQW